MRKVLARDCKVLCGYPQVIISEARIRNYHELWLDTVSRLDAALKLYASMGFTEIAPYNSHAEEDVCYRGLKL